MENQDFDGLPVVVRRFLSYTQYATASDPTSRTIPSTKSQLEFAQELENELKSLGIRDAHTTDAGIVMASLPASAGLENNPTLGFIAHMDTSPEAPGEPVKWRIVKNYDGGDIVLNERRDIVLRTARFPEVARYKGADLIVTDGTTLLGADDKAGISVVMSVAAYFAMHPEVPHAKLVFAFTPDEEIGRGTDYFDIKAFGADYAYTIDGGEVGALDTETFNAAIANVSFRGISVHPGSAKNKMVSALRLATDFVAQLPMSESPENTEGYEGYYHPIDIKGGVSSASLCVLIRDHDAAMFETRKRFIAELASRYDQYEEGACHIEIQDQYLNMKTYLDRTPTVAAIAREAFEACQLTPIEKPVRGGTDGARLSAMGLPCPNIFTGGLNFHGVYECLPVASLVKAQDVALDIAKRSASVTTIF